MVDQSDDDPIWSWTPVPSIPWTSIGPDLSPITFDQDGDLILTVGPEDKNQEMQVDSRALCRASLVFRKMLRGNFAEAQPETGEWHVRLPDDNVEGFAVLMDMVHIQSTRTPWSPEIPLLYEIVRLADKYDMTQILRPVAAKWLIKHQYKLDNIWFDNCIKLLFIARQMGASSLFEGLVVHLAEIAYVDADDHLADYHDGTGTRYEDLPELSSIELLGKF